MPMSISESEIIKSKENNKKPGYMVTVGSLATCYIITQMEITKKTPTEIISDLIRNAVENGLIS
jgi:hypothetical protein